MMDGMSKEQVALFLMASYASVKGCKIEVFDGIPVVVNFWPPREYGSTPQDSDIFSWYREALKAVNGIS